MTDTERKDNILSVYNKLVWSPSQDEGLDEADTTEEADTTKKVAVSTPKEAIDIDSDDDKDNDGKDKDDFNADTTDGGDVKDDNTLHPREARKKGNEESDEDTLFSNDKDNNHDDHNSESSDDESEKKKSRRTPKKTHWSGNRLPAAQEAATVLVAIGATRNVASFMVAGGLNKIAEIQKLTRETISLYAKNSRKNLLSSDIVSTRFILDLEKAAFKMTHIKNRISRIIDPADIKNKWCRSMNDQILLEQGWDNEPLKYLYPTQALLSNSAKWMEMLQNVLCMIRDANGVPLAVVICKRVVP